MKVAVAQWQSTARADHSRCKKLCCGEGWNSFGDRKRAYSRSALKPSSRLCPAQSFRCGEGARYFLQERSGESRRGLRTRKPACLERDRSSNQLTRADRSYREICTAKSGCATRCRDGAEKSYFVCQTTRGSPRNSARFSSRRILAGANRGPVGGSRRGGGKKTTMRLKSASTVLAITNT